MDPRRPIAVFLLVPLLAVAAGCASPSADAKAVKKEAAEEYILIPVTGSNIPKRIKKSDVLQDRLPKDGDSQVVDKEQFLRSLGPGKKIERGS